MARDARFTPAEAAALDVMGLGLETDRRGLRRRYSDLVRRYHPDRNGGDRRHEARLRRVVEAYQLLRKSAGAAVSGRWAGPIETPAFAGVTDE